MSDKVNDNESTPVTAIHNYDGGEQIDAEELAAILEQAGAGDEGCAQIVDAEGNILTLTAEQLAQAGIDISNIGEADVETLLQLAQGAANSGSVEISIGGSGSATNPLDVKSPKKRSSVDIQGSDVGSESVTKKFKLDSSMVHRDHDGNEDDEITELDEQTLASLVQSGTVKFVDEAGNEIPASTVLAGTQGALTASDLMPASSDERKLHSTKISRSGSSSSPAKSGTTYALVGSEVEVKRGNRRVPATVRYVRQGIGYKVQFEDGRFEWVNENEVIINGVSSSHGDAPSGVAADHEYLVDDQDDEGLIDSPGTLSNYKTGGPPPILTPQQPASSLTKRPTNGVMGSGLNNAARKSFQHVHAADRSNQSSSSGGGGRNETKNSSSGTNFVCPICETKVFNKEPSYIVIRLPACDDCAESKILVLDDNTSTK